MWATACSATRRTWARGSITSNVKSDKTLVVARDGAERIETGLKKFGAILGDNVEVGCNSVLNPGCVLGRRVSVYPTTAFAAPLPEDCIFKGRRQNSQREFEVRYPGCMPRVMNFELIVPYFKVLMVLC